MPAFIGNRMDSLAAQPAAYAPVGTVHVPVKFATAAVMADKVQIFADLNTSDKGGPGRKAKRWWNWSADARAILTCDAATPIAKSRAADALYGVDQIRALDAALYAELHTLGAAEFASKYMIGGAVR